MKKLLKLLNEFKDSKLYQFIGYNKEYGMFDTNLNAEGNTSLPEKTIISKKFGFIERLVIYAKVEYGLIEKLTIFDNDGKMYGYTDTLLMHLSTQDDPIDFLVSILR